MPVQLFPAALTPPGVSSTDGCLLPRSAGLERVLRASAYDLRSTGRSAGGDASRLVEETWPMAGEGCGSGVAGREPSDPDRSVDCCGRRAVAVESMTSPVFLWLMGGASGAPPLGPAPRTGLLLRSLSDGSAWALWEAPVSPFLYWD